MGANPDRVRTDVEGRVTGRGCGGEDHVERSVTIPKAVREALRLSEGDRVAFRVIEGERAILARTRDLLEAPARR